MSFAEFESYDAVGLADLVRRREVRPLELVEAALARIEARNPRINAVVHTRAEAAFREAGRAAGGPLGGVPFLLKDLGAAMAGDPLTAGCRFLRDHVPDHDSELVRRYRAAGLVVLGRTNTPEFGIAPTTEPLLWGPTRNPWDPTRSAGGSSGGAAAAVTTGMVPAAHGSDGGGSIRIPASCCGVFGLKPTRGRTPTGPDRGPKWQGASVDHALTRTVRDSAALLDATEGPDVGAPYWAPPADRPFLDEVSREPGALRVAYTTDPLLLGETHPTAARAVEDAAHLLEDLGHRVVEARPDIDGLAFVQSFITMVASELAADMDDAVRTVGRSPGWTDFEPSTWALALLGRTISAAELASALRVLYGQVRRVGRFFRMYDILLTPTLAAPPARLGTYRPTFLEGFLARLVRAVRGTWIARRAGLVEHMAARTFAYIPFTPIFNATGQPAMSVPLFWSDEGLPIGTQFVGRFGDEATLFRLAGQLERARPWFDRRPPIAQDP